MFLKILEAVLKTGNRMNIGTNRGDAHAFKLDALLKLIDVKGTDGKTTLLHFVVQEIIKSEGARISTPETNDTKCRKLGLHLVTNISSELSNVKKAATIDSEVLHSDVTKLSKGIFDISQVANFFSFLLFFFQLRFQGLNTHHYLVQCFMYQILSQKSSTLNDRFKLLRYNSLL